MEGFGRSWTGTWKGAGGRWRVLTGLEGVAGCSQGRRGRNVRQRAVTSSAKPVKCRAHFFCTVSLNPAPRCRRGGNAAAATGVAGGRQPAYTWTYSTANDPRTPRRRCLLYQDLIRSRPPEVAGERLPAVLYNGTEPWTAAPEMRALITPVGRWLAPYQPAQRYCLLDLRRLPADAAQLRQSGARRRHLGTRARRVRYPPETRRPGLEPGSPLKAPTNRSPS